MTVYEAWKVPSVLCRLKILLVLLPAKLCIRNRATGVRKSTASRRGRTRREQEQPLGKNANKEEIQGDKYRW